uniref:Cathepsin H n=1 Tax=Oryctolagus cuniculus TaxID=9986 RepID=A0A5F9DN39_RABIT
MCACAHRGAVRDSARKRTGFSCSKYIPRLGASQGAVANQRRQLSRDRPRPPPRHPGPSGQGRRQPRPASRPLPWGRQGSRVPSQCPPRTAAMWAALSLLCAGAWLLGAPGADAFSANNLEKFHFKSWMSQHHKKYSAEEYPRRLQTFVRNWRKINAHNNGNHTFQMGLNQFSDMSFAEIKHKYLWTEPQNCSATKSNYLRGTGPYPSSVDWRKKGNFVSPVKNQAEQQLVDCAQNFNNHGCEGGLPSQAFEYILYNKGIMGEDSYPYRAMEGRCKFQPQKAIAFVKDVANITLVSSSPFSHWAPSGRPCPIAAHSHQFSAAVMAPCWRWEGARHRHADAAAPSSRFFCLRSRCTGDFCTCVHVPIHGIRWGGGGGVCMHHIFSGVCRLHVCGIHVGVCVHVRARVCVRVHHFFSGVCRLRMCGIRVGVCVCVYVCGVHVGVCADTPYPQAAPRARVQARCERGRRAGIIPWVCVHEGEARRVCRCRSHCHLTQVPTGLLMWGTRGRSLVPLPHSYPCSLKVPREVRIHPPSHRAGSRWGSLIPDQGSWPGRHPATPWDRGRHGFPSGDSRFV